MAARRSVALRASLAIGLTLTACALLGDAHDGLLAAQGCFAGLYGSQAPYARRARVVVLVAALMAVSTVLGTYVAGSLLRSVVVAGLYTFSASLLAVALRLGPPREFFPVMVFLLMTQLPGDLRALPQRVGLVLAGAALAALLSLAPALTRRPRPEQLAAQRALQRIADLLAALATPAAPDARHAAILAVRAGVAAADECGGASCAPTVERMTRIERLLEAVMALEVEGSPALSADWPALVRRLADQSVGSAPHDPRRRGEPLPPLPSLDAAERVREAVVALRDGTLSLESHELSAARPPRSRWLAPSQWLILRAPYPRIALRMSLVVMLGLLGSELGLQRSSWIAVSAAAVLQGAHARVIAKRALHRAVGTMLGVLLAGFVLHVSLSTWWLIAVIALLQGAVELLVLTSYGLAVVLITPLVLLISQLGGTADPGALVSVRVVDTLVGCAVAALVVLVTRSRSPTGRLPVTQAEVLSAIGAVLASAFQAAPSAAQLARARGQLQAALLELRAAEQEAIGDALWADPKADARWPITALLERTAQLALTFPPHLPASTLDVSRLRREIDELVAAVRARQRKNGSAQLAAASDALLLPGLPRTTAALRELRQTLLHLHAAPP